MFITLPVRQRIVRDDIEEVKRILSCPLKKFGIFFSTVGSYQNGASTEQT